MRHKASTKTNKRKQNKVQNKKQRRPWLIPLLIMAALLTLVIIVPRIFNDDKNNEETQQEPAINQSAEDKIWAKIKEMTLEEKVAQLFIITPEALTGYQNLYGNEEALKESFNNYPVGGLIFFSKNISTPQEIKEATAICQNASLERIGLPMLISIDEEGGQVARIANNTNFNVEKFPTLNNINTGTEAFNLGSTIGEYLQDFGFNLDFAPVADVYTNKDNEVVDQRAFSSDADLVGELVTEEIKGFKTQGILTTLKHFPGHGNTSGDTHLGLAYTEKTLEEMRSLEFIPFKKGIEAGADLVMIGHISAPKVVGDDTPCSFSQLIIKDVLRKELGFKGVVITDALNMGAVTDWFGGDKAAVEALKAGVDILLMPDDFDLAYTAVLKAVKSGELKKEDIDQSLFRILLLKESLK